MYLPLNSIIATTVPSILHGFYNIPPQQEKANLNGANQLAGYWPHTPATFCLLSPQQEHKFRSLSSNSKPIFTKFRNNHLENVTSSFKLGWNQMTGSIFQEGPTHADGQHDHVSFISSGNWSKNTYFLKKALNIYFLSPN